MNYLIAHLKSRQQNWRLEVYGPIEWRVQKHILDWQLF